MIHRKNKSGQGLIKVLSSPDAYGERNRDPELIKQMGDYCLDDVRAERSASMATPALTDEEFRDYLILEKMNDRGMKFDLELAVAAAKCADQEAEEISGQLSEITNGEITSPSQHVRIRKYLEPLMKIDDGVRKAMTRIETDRRTGEEKRRISCDVRVREIILGLEREEPGRLPEDVKDLLEVLDRAANSNVHKFTNMVLRAGSDDRVYGCYMFSGAQQTGRPTSPGLNVLNFPRDTAPEPEVTRQKILDGEPLGEGVEDLRGMLRPAIIAEKNHVLVWGDATGQEFRILRWLADDPDAKLVLDIIERHDRDPSLPDVYTVTAAAFYGVPVSEVTPEQRQGGKVDELSLGFGGGRRALQSMADKFKLTINDDEADEMVRVWRMENPWARRFWNALEKATRSAVQYPGELFEAGRLKYCCPEEGAPLYCELPSGRMLSYPNPRLDLVDGPYGPQWELTSIKPQWKPRKGETRWGRITLWGGHLAENATQALGQCLIRHALRLADEDGWPVIGSTYDELLFEVLDDEIEDATEALEAILLDKPSWAEGLPMACESWSGTRYCKT